MGVMKAIGYLLAAVIVVTALCCGGLFIILAGMAVGILLDVVGAVLLTAISMRAYFSNKS